MGLTIFAAQMLKLGQYNKLKILRSTDPGLFLGNEEGDEVLLPNKYRPKKFEIGDMLDVFVYLDSEDRPVATNLEPRVTLNQFALLKVKATNKFGAFMDWGLEKDLMIPFSEQRAKMREGRWYIIYLALDFKTNRLFGSNRLEHFLSNEDVELSEGEKVEVMILEKTDIGFSVIINHKHKGLIYKNELFQDLFIGQVLDGYVKKVRDDNKVDISLQPIGYNNAITTQTDELLQVISDEGGLVYVTDKSSPDEIYDTFGISKKAFKKAVGALYKARKIILEEDCIRLVR